MILVRPPLNVVRRTLSAILAAEEIHSGLMETFGNLNPLLSKWLAPWHFLVFCNHGISIFETLKTASTFLHEPAGPGLLEESLRSCLKVAFKKRRLRFNGESDSGVH